MAKKNKAKKSLLVPSQESELAQLLATAINGKARIPAVGVTYELEWERSNGELFASLRVVAVSRKPNSSALRVAKI